MNMPAAPNPGQNPRVGRAFESFVDDALRERAVGTTALPSPLDPEPRALLRYVGGRATADERPALESFVARSAWAYERVLALTKAGRPDAPPLARALARRLPGAPTVGAAIAAAVLEARGEPADDLEGAAKRIDAKDPTTRAAVLLGLGRHDEARKLLEPSRRDALSDLLRRLASISSARVNDIGASPSRETADPDQALIAVLDAFPALLDTREPGRSPRP